MLLAACGGAAVDPSASASAATVAAGRETALAATVADTAPTAVAAADPGSRTGPSGTNWPIVLNATTSARPGDVISLQGANFGSAPVVFFDGAPGTPLQIVNSVATNWLAVQIPTTATGPLLLRVSNATGTSAQVRVNAAKPLHLDALQLVPGGAFRLFGRNLILSGYRPHLTIDGIAATVVLAQSNEYMLTAYAPATLQPTSAAAVVVDNGTASGKYQLDRTIQVVASGTGDPFALGVGWGAAFSSVASHIVDATGDPRMPVKVQCNGNVDDSPAVQNAINLAAADGGGIVRLPAGRCLMFSSMNLQSRVVVQGAGKSATELVYAANYPVYGIGLDLSGIRNLTLTNSGSALEGPLLKDSTRVVLQNVKVQMGTSRQMYLSGNTHFVVAGSDFIQAGSVSQQGPYILNNSSGLVFTGNTTQWVGGAPAFGQVHDSYIQGNHFTRDGAFQNAGGTVHSLTLDFAYRVAVVGNTFDVMNGPITNVTRNDGEAVLCEGGGASRTENLGTVATATATTVSDPANTINVDPFGTGSIPEDYGIAIVGGTGAGQTRQVVAYTWPTLTVDRAWDITPDATSHYATFVWGVEKSLIKDNNFSQNPRGIWLYHTAIRDVDVVGNSISEGGGIYLRSYQNLLTKSFMPIYNVLIARNKVVNTTRNWSSYVTAVFVNSDALAFGIANIGIEMRSNAITANQPNVSSAYEEYAGIEGFMNMMRVENYNGYQSSPMPRMLGTIIANDSCTNCDIAVRVGTGAGGTTILNMGLVNSPSLLADWATTSSSETSFATVVH